MKVRLARVHYKNQCNRGSKLNCTTFPFSAQLTKTSRTASLFHLFPNTNCTQERPESLQLHQKQSWHTKPKSRTVFVWCPQRLASGVNPIRANWMAFRLALGSNTRAETFLWEQQIFWPGMCQWKEQCLEMGTGATGYECPVCRGSKKYL